MKYDAKGLGKHVAVKSYSSYPGKCNAENQPERYNQVHQDAEDWCSKREEAKQLPVDNREERKF